MGGRRRRSQKVEVKVEGASSELISFVWLWEVARDAAERVFVFHRIMQRAVTAPACPVNKCVPSKRACNEVEIPVIDEVIGLMRVLQFDES